MTLGRLEFKRHILVAAFNNKAFPPAGSSLTWRGRGESNAEPLRASELEVEVSPLRSRTPLTPAYQYQPTPKMLTPPHLPFRQDNGFRLSPPMGFCNDN